MKVALDMTAPAGEQLTGIGVFAEKLAEALERTGAVDLVRMAPRAGTRMSTPRRLYWDQWEVRRKVSASGADLLHSLGFGAVVGLSTPQVVTIHDLLPVEMPSEAPTASADFYWRRYLPFTLGSAERLVADSAFTRDQVRRLCPNVRAPVDVIHLGVDTPPAPPSDAEVQARLAARGLDGPYILAVGAILPRKGLASLVRAMGRLTRDLGHPALTLVIAGKEGPGSAELEGAIEAQRLWGAVKVLGYVPQDELEALYRGATALAFPSEGEGFGLPPLEAMARGVPVVASDGGSLPEVLGDAALLVPAGNSPALADGLHQVLADDALRARLAAKGPARASRFSWDRTANAYLESYRAVLGPDPRWTTTFRNSSMVRDSARRPGSTPAFSRP